MEIKKITTVAYQVITPIGNRRYFTTEGAYRALAKRMIKNHPRWQCYCERGIGTDTNHSFTCDIHGSEEMYLHKLQLQDRLVRFLKRIYPKERFTKEASGE